MIEQYAVSAICFTVAFSCLFYSWLKKRDFFQPILVFTFAQFLTLGISYTKILHTMSDFRLMTWMVWIGGVSSFILGCSVFYLLYYRRYKPEFRFEPPHELLKYNWQLHFALTLVVFVFFLIGAYSMYSMMGLSIFRIHTAGEYSGNGNQSTFVLWTFALSPLLTILFSISAFKSINPNKWMRWISAAMAFLIPVITLCVYPGRMTLFLSIGPVVVIYNNVKKRIASGWILLAAVLAIAIFIGVSIAREQYGIGGVKGMVAKQVAELPYKYIANNYWNLDYAISASPDRAIHDFTYGIDALNGPMGMFRFSSSIRNMMSWDNELNQSIQKMHGLNTINYLWETYKDFGILGPILVSFIAAFLTSYLYEMMKRRKTPFFLMTYSIAIFYVGWSFFFAGYKFPHIWMWVYILFVITRICSRRPRIAN